MSQFERTALLLGEEAIETLSRKKVAIFGLGGRGQLVLRGPGPGRCGAAGPHRP